MTARPKPSDPVVSSHAAIRFAERFGRGHRLTDDDARAEVAKLVKTGERWGPSVSRPDRSSTWHLLVTWGDGADRETFVLAMASSPNNFDGRPVVVTCLSLDHAIANQKRSFR